MSCPYVQERSESSERCADPSCVSWGQFFQHSRCCSGSKHEYRHSKTPARKHSAVLSLCGTDHCRAWAKSESRVRPVKPMLHCSDRSNLGHQTLIQTHTQRQAWTAKSTALTSKLRHSSGAHTPHRATCNAIPCMRPTPPRGDAATVASRQRAPDTALHAVPPLYARPLLIHATLDTARYSVLRHTRHLTRYQLLDTAQ